MERFEIEFGCVPVWGSEDRDYDDSILEMYGDDFDEMVDREMAKHNKAEEDNEANEIE